MINDFFMPSLPHAGGTSCNSPLALIATPPHEHFWVEICRKDRTGFSVEECGCGSRRRVMRGPSGSQVVPAPPGDPLLGDVLFDCSVLPGSDLRTIYQAAGITP